jgi:beta-lactamase regulating signal transducer with metallopeptidase domain
MILYLFKLILCSAVFLLVYLLLLEKEKMHRFNRWYLLGSIACSVLIPLISFTIQPQTLPVLQNVQETYFEIVRFTQNTNTASVVTQKTQTYYLTTALWVLYSFVCIGLLIRFISNIYVLLSQTAKNTIVPYNSAKLVLLKEKVVSHTFLQYIFVSEADFTGHAIEEEILTHEFTHVKEKHSWDILFVELVHTIFWFNPLFIFYKKAIQLNHEFLADDAVVRNSFNIQAYQYLLLEKISLGNKAYLTSPFNFSATKKRLVMMTRKVNPTISLLKKMLTLPVLAATLVLFSTKLILAQVQDKPKSNPSKTEISSSTGGVSKELLDEYDAIIARNMTKTKNGHDILGQVSDAERNRMITIFKQMNKAQQKEAKVVFMKRVNPLPKEMPTETQLNAWKDSKTYGIWIDEKRVGNDELSKHKAADFSNYFASKLSKNAINYGKHYVQVDLMTNDFYTNYIRKETELRNKYPLEMLYRLDKKGLFYIN